MGERMIKRIRLWWLRRRRAAKLDLIGIYEDAATRCAARRDLYAQQPEWNGEYRAYDEMHRDYVAKLVIERHQLSEFNRKIVLLTESA